MVQILTKIKCVVDVKLAYYFNKDIIVINVHKKFNYFYLIKINIFIH
jgi:hypothetical protein